MSHVTLISSWYQTDSHFLYPIFIKLSITVTFINKLLLLYLCIEYRIISLSKYRTNPVKKFLYELCFIGSSRIHSKENSICNDIRGIHMTASTLRKVSYFRPFCLLGRL